MQEKKHGAAKDLGGRLREWRRSMHLKGYELAKMIHISQGSMSDIENNNSLPSADTVAKLYQHTQINIIWLLTGKGPMNRNKSALDEEALASESAPGDDQALKELIEKVIRIYRRGDPDKRAHLKGFLMGADPGD
ncbi:MAG: hypothetical protein A3K09_00350 [Nitrospinae bacterium RIFCSPLOWO2_12_FULL_47_7]|nr:MAG: hypothetical protein A3K09_00350 [Nitrospinae bacterium RIFCSPLOWO2_12_FULL_47_7]